MILRERSEVEKLSNWTVYVPNIITAPPPPQNQMVVPLTPRFLHFRSILGRFNYNKIKLGRKKRRTMGSNKQPLDYRPFAFPTELVRDIYEEKDLNFTVIKTAQRYG